jgi:hypothetical protein
MTHEKIEKRDSRALEPQLITDPKTRAEVEARNVLRQYDAGLERFKVPWSVTHFNSGLR